MAILASEENLEARSFFPSTLHCVPHIFVTNGLATGGSRVALAWAHVATPAIARLCRRCQLLPTHASLEGQCAGAIRTPRPTRDHRMKLLLGMSAVPPPTRRQCPGRDRKTRRR